MKKAACLLIELDNKSVYLAVSRRNDDTQWGLPGGKVDPGETPAESVIRESFEEIGLVVDESEIELLYTGICPGEVTYEVSTYKYIGPFSIFDIDFLETEEGLSLSTLTKSELCDPKNSPFADYNTRIFESMAGMTLLTQ
jgi:8-oxo-dGTP pyrophosphatase MutT (NUDIX family)